MTDRRLFVKTAAAGLACITPAVPTARAGDKKKDKGEEGVGATEDLMREHGVLNRVLLVYEEGLRRLRAKEDIPPEVFRSPEGANLVIVGHKPNLQDAADKEFVGLAEGEVAVFKPLGAGKFKAVVRVTSSRWTGWAR
jgi:hypothetical protein